MPDVLDEIVRRRRSDIEELGLAFGCDIPEKRPRPLHPFLRERGAILEVKRASPSRGDIAPRLDAADTARQYEAAGAAAISVLTEQRYFKGSLEDLISVASAANRAAVLRKDFLLAPEEIEISYKCGADAVLLIARLLSREDLLSCARECARLGMTAFVELRLPEDIEKYAYVTGEVDSRYLACGVNSRDLSNFRTDLLYPVRMMRSIKARCGRDVRIVFESGILTENAAFFAGSLGFWGMLLGEAAAKNPAGAPGLVRGFVSSAPTANSAFWTRVTGLLSERRPLIKICGLTNERDALSALDAGADMLGFIVSAKSPRKIEAADAERIVREIRRRSNRAVTCAVITDTSSDLSRGAISLCRDGGIDCLQLHGFSDENIARYTADRAALSLPHFFALSLTSGEDLAKADKLKAQGEPRYLIDSRADGKIGGTGKTLDKSIVSEAEERNPLWLSGGINPDNIASMIRTYSPELLDASSGVEARAGIKDGEKIRALFEAAACANPQG